MKQQKQIQTRQEANLLPKSVFHISAETYIERDWFDSEVSGNFRFECIAEPIKSSRKTWLERFGFRNYTEMKECERGGD